MDSPLRPDPDAAVAFLADVRPSGFWVLVSIDPEAGAEDRHKCTTRSFAARESAEARAWIDRQNTDGLNVYWTVNAVARPLSSKPSKTDIDSIELLHVDVDPDKRAPLAEERARIERLFADGWPAKLPRPSIVIDSGGGLQGFWRLAEPIKIGGDVPSAEDVERYNRQIQAVLDGDKSCHNADRIMRLPGTINWPNERKRAAGRVPALARLLSSSPERHPITAFTPAPKLQSTTEAAFDTPRASVNTSNVVRLLSLDELPAAVSGNAKVVINQGSDPDNPRRWQSRSEPLFWVCCEMVRHNTPDDVIFSVITDPEFGISESVLEKGARAERYALQQIQHAHEHCDEPNLAELNRRHAVIADLGGRCRVLAETWDPVLEREHLSPQGFEDFYHLYSNRFVVEHTDKGEKRTELGRWWVQHPSRRQYHRMVFAPGRDVPGCLNLWRGFAVQAIPGDCSLYLRHVLDNICRGEQRLYDYLLSWMARAVQRPDLAAETAIVMRGERGTGKGVFATNFGKLFGRHFMPITNPTQVFGQFNEHLLDTVVLFADEAFYAGDKRNEAVLKGLVTEEYRMSEAKYARAEPTPNYLHLIMSANADWVVPAGKHERRFLVLEVGEDRRQVGDYFEAIRDQLDSGGREALLHELLTRDISAFKPNDVPRTAALQEQKEHSLSLEEEWWFSKLRAGEVRSGAGWPAWVACTEMLFDFSEHARLWGKGQRPSAARAAKLLEKLGIGRKQLGREAEVLTERGDPTRVDRPRVWDIPALDVARASWAKNMGGEWHWDALETLVDREQELPYA